MKKALHRLERLFALGGIKKDIILLAVSGIAVICSLIGFQPFPFDIAWAAIILCGIPINAEAIIGLVTAFDIKADVLVSIALIASVCTGEDFAAGEVACFYPMPPLHQHFGKIYTVKHSQNDNCRDTVGYKFLERKFHVLCSSLSIHSSKNRICSSVWNQCSPPGITVRPAPIREANPDTVSSEVRLSLSP